MHAPCEREPSSARERRHEDGATGPRWSWVARGIVATLPFVALLGLWGSVGPFLSPLGATVLFVALPALGVTLSLRVYHQLTPYRPKLDGHTRCGECGYILKGLVELRCPECGRRI